MTTSKYEKGDDKMFQLKLSFKTENNILPKSLDQSIVSFLKATAQSVSQDFFDELYDKSKSIIKSYTYAYYLPGAKFQGNQIILSNNGFTMFFSGYRMEDMMRFYNGFIKMKNQKYSLSNNSMTLTHVDMQELKEIKEHEIIIKMQSALIVRQHNAETNQDIYYTCEQEGFSEALRENIDFFIKQMNLNISTEGFSILPVKAKKVVVPIFGRNTDGNLGVFKLTGSSELLNLLYLSGLGCRRSCGHGKFEIIG